MRDPHREGAAGWWLTALMPRLTLSPSHLFATYSHRLLSCLTVHVVGHHKHLITSCVAHQHMTQSTFIPLLWGRTWLNNWFGAGALTLLSEFIQFWLKGPQSFHRTNMKWCVHDTSLGILHPNEKCIKCLVGRGQTLDMLYTQAVLSKWLDMRGKVYCLHDIAENLQSTWKKFFAAGGK